MENLDATGEKSLCSLVHPDKIRYPSATLASETDERYAPCFWRTQSVSINDVYQARIVGWDCSSLPNCVRKFRYTWASDLDSIFFVEFASPGTQKNLTSYLVI
ncbi:hypothetical protein AVEN_28255-1 [Araneus ventricosus]|uniref:Uncharacterized protein n=1 Tax=Araneus ventricosus TaxID=182803 RepID=A0A4Y2DJD5_ARAVE|nr:hypothetical protein AVEN_28255-1 [Araneus ventricosus]